MLSEIYLGITYNAFVVAMAGSCFAKSILFVFTRSLLRWDAKGYCARTQRAVAMGRKGLIICGTQVYVTDKLSSHSLCKQ